MSTPSASRPATSSHSCCADCPSQSAIIMTVMSARVPSDLGAPLLERVDFARQRAHVESRMPTLRPPGHCGDRALFTGAADADRWVRLLERLWVAGRVQQLVVPALKRRRVPGQQGEEASDAFVEPIRSSLSIADRQPVGLVLSSAPTGPEAEFEAAVGQDVDGRGHVRENRRVTVDHAGHEASAPKSRGRLQQRGQRGPAIQARTEWLDFASISARPDPSAQRTESPSGGPEGLLVEV